MIATLNMAAEKQAYRQEPSGHHCRGDKALFNQYSVIAVNPAQC